MLCNIKYLKPAFVLLKLLVFYAAGAQTLDTISNGIDYHRFINLVGKNNLAYTAEKFNLAIAEANLLSSSIFPDPELEFNYANNEDGRMQMGYGYGAELRWTLELGGKRKSRINVAKNESQLTKLILKDYFQQLRADATLAYLEAIKQKYILKAQTVSYQQMQKLATADSIRFQLGSITLMGAQQSKLEAATQLHEVYAAQANLNAALADLSLLMGDVALDRHWTPLEDLNGFDRTFSLQHIVNVAQNNRVDLKVALQQKDLSQSLVKLAKANRAIDLGLSIAVDYNSEARNTLAPSPSFNTANVGVSIPLKFSNKRAGELHAAQHTLQQAEQYYQQNELLVKTEVQQAFFLYEAERKKVLHFNTGLLSTAKEILDGKTYSYQRGETSLLEVLDAQRTFNEMQQNYYETLYNHAASLVQLERAVGIWDISF